MEYHVDNIMYAAGDELYNTIRTGITFTEPIDEQILRDAVDRLVLRFPYFGIKFERRGDNLYYVQNKEPFVITSDGEPITLGGPESNYQLLAFTYKDNTLFIDTSHFLMDGGGKFMMLKMLLFEYLSRKYPDHEFDSSDFPQPGDEIHDDEITDMPYPDEELPVDFPKMQKRTKEVFQIEGFPSGYENMDKWMSYRIKVKQSEMMEYASKNDASPATFISSLTYRAIAQLNPDNKLPIVCGMQHQFRKALGNLRSHSSHVVIAPIVYPDDVREKDLEYLNTLGRGTLLLYASDEQDAHLINHYLEVCQYMEDKTFKQKQRLMRKVVKSTIGKNTFEVSYTGRVKWNGLDKYLTCFTPYIDLELSGGLSIEIFALGEYFDINIMQRNNDDRYVNHIIKQLQDLNITVIQEEPEHFRINGFVLPE